MHKTYKQPLVALSMTSQGIMVIMLKLLFYKIYSRSQKHSYIARGVRFFVIISIIETNIEQYFVTSVVLAFQVSGTLKNFFWVWRYSLNEHFKKEKLEASTDVSRILYSSRQNHHLLNFYINKMFRSFL